MRLITAEEIRAALDFEMLVEELKVLHREDTEAMDELLIGETAGGEPSNFFIRAAWQRNKAVGAKVVTIFPGNTSSGTGLPSVHAVYNLFDGSTGQPLAVLDGTELTYWKTAGDSALGSGFLARRDARRMLMIGAGALAPHLIAAHRAMRPGIESVEVWNRTAARAAALAERLARSGIDSTAVEDLPGAAGRADLICCATMSPEPVLKGEWLKPGAHVDLVGAYTPAMREVDDRCLERANLFVDSRATTIHHIGELMIPLAAGTITESDILADHYDLCRGRHAGRTSDDEITVFKNGGGGHLDLMTARIIHRALA